MQNKENIAVSPKTAWRSKVALQPARSAVWGNGETTKRSMDFYGTSPSNMGEPSAIKT
jgi:hypothetical protein